MNLTALTYLIYMIFVIFFIGDPWLLYFGRVNITAKYVTITSIIGKNEKKMLTLKQIK